jgi:DNA polymerase I-like protein with 3'-5' exonuclease and polymerase domains
MLLEFDLAGADWFVTAFVAREPNMIAVFRAGKSPHPVTGARLTGLSEDLIKAEDKMLAKLVDSGERMDQDGIARMRREHFPEILAAPWFPRTFSIRQAAKKANHGLNYRLQYKTYSLKNEIPEREAKQVIDLYRKKAYPGLAVSARGNLCWYDRIDKQIRDTRTMKNCFGRTVYFSGALDDDTFREATSFVPQSTVFDVTGRAMHLMMEDDSADFAPAEKLAQVHDSLLFQYLSLDFAAMARFAIKFGLDYMSPTLDYGEPFTLGVGLKVGRNWGGLKEIKLTPDVEALTGEFRRVWEETAGRAPPLTLAA